jgi:hypothetical protein
MFTINKIRTVNRGHDRWDCWMGWDWGPGAAGIGMSSGAGRYGGREVL